MLPICIKDRCIHWIDDNKLPLANRCKLQHYGYGWCGDSINMKEKEITVK